MPFIHQQLALGENVLYRARPHWVTLVAPLAIAVALGVPGVLLIVFSVAFWMDNFAVQSAFATGLLMVVGTGAIAFGLLHLAAEVVITNRRILVTSGVLLKRRVAQWLLQEIDAFEIQQDDLGRVLDYGSIVVHAAGKTSGPFRYVSQPLELRLRVEQEIRKSPRVSTKIAA